MTSTSSTSPTENPPQQQQPPPPKEPNSLLSLRSRKQFLLFAAGSTFLLLSTFRTSRALTTRRRSVIPKFYNQSNLPPPHLNTLNGPFEAFEALSLATVNVASFAMTMVGGMLWAFDISTLEELRGKVRGGLGVDGSGRSEKDVEEEFEEWIAGVLSRKEEKRKRRGKVEDREEGEATALNERGKPR